MILENIVTLTMFMGITLYMCGVTSLVLFTSAYQYLKAKYG